MKLRRIRKTSGHSPWRRLTAFLIVIPLFLSGCESLNEMGNKEKIGTGIGSVLGGTIGAVVGKQAGKDDKWVVVGGVTGALLGGVIGNRIGHAFDERDKRIKEAAKTEKLKVETEVVALPAAEEGPQVEKPEPQDQKELQKRGVYALTISEIEQFPVGSATLTPNARRFLRLLPRLTRKMVTATSLS